MQYTRRLATGIATFVPGVRLLSERTTGSMHSARYCYWVWLRHLVAARDSGLPTQFPTVVELGPGDSLGTGLAALLTGTDHYYASDLISYARPEHNLRILDELVGLLRNRTPIPEGDFAPRLLPSVTSPRTSSPKSDSTPPSSLIASMPSVGLCRIVVSNTPESKWSISRRGTLSIGNRAWSSLTPSWSM